MKHIIAKFNSKCVETGNQIKKGDRMLYDINTKKCYSQTSNVYKEFMNDEQFIPCPSEQYFDNFCQQNNI